MKDSERAKTYLRDLFTRRPGGHAYEPDDYVRADQDASAIADLMDLLAEVREDERRKHKHPGPIERLEQIFGPSNPAKPKRVRDRFGDIWVQDTSGDEIWRLESDPDITISSLEAYENYGPLVEVSY